VVWAGAEAQRGERRASAWRGQAQAQARLGSGARCTGDGRLETQTHACASSTASRVRAGAARSTSSRTRPPAHLVWWPYALILWELGTWGVSLRFASKPSAPYGPVAGACKGPPARARGGINAAPTRHAPSPYLLRLPAPACSLRLYLRYGMHTRSATSLLPPYDPMYYILLPTGYTDNNRLKIGIRFYLYSFLNQKNNLGPY
jgi:hypothetical protein